MKVMKQDELPFSNIAHEFVGADHGGVGVCLILVDAPPDRGPRLHQHPYAEVFLVQDGEARFRTSDEERTVGAGELVVVPPGTPHGFVSGDNGRLRLIAIQAAENFSTEWLED
jgi:mannose-6-phosphate isomerase-like protein (cupin superfamily)